MLNFSWWVNRKDPLRHINSSRALLDLHNIGVFDCSSPLPTGGHLEQADGIPRSRCSPETRWRLPSSWRPRIARTKTWPSSCRVISVLLPVNESNSAARHVGDDNGSHHHPPAFPHRHCQLARGRSMVGLLPLRRHHRHPAVQRQRAPANILRLPPCGNVCKRMPELAESIHVPGSARRFWYGERGIAVFGERGRLRRILQYACSMIAS